MLRHLVIALALLGATGFGITACDFNEGPFEEAGEDLDQAADDVEDGLDEVSE